MISKTHIHRQWFKLRTLAKNRLGARLLSTTQQDSKVLYKNYGDHAWEITLNSPKTLNALDSDMVDSLWSKLKEWHSQASPPKVIFMKGAGEKAFWAGGDIKAIYDGGVKGINPETPKEFFAKEYIVDYGLTKTKPIQIPIWNGIVMGGGVGVSVHAPIRIATEKSVFAMPETGIGFFTDVGGSYFLPRISENPAYGTYLGLSGFRLKSKDLLKWGVATNYIETKNITDLYEDMIASVSDNSTFQQIKDIVDKHSDKTDNEMYTNKTIEYVFKPDSIHNIKKRLEEVASGEHKNYDQEFAQKTLKKLSSCSPISCAVVVEQIRRGKDMSLKEVFKMEYCISQAFMDHGEFYEGVRALLIDKDNNAQWKNKSIDEVTQKEIDFFFDRNENLNLDFTKDFKDAITYT